MNFKMTGDNSNIIKAKPKFLHANMKVKINLNNRMDKKDALLTLESLARRLEKSCNEAGTKINASIDNYWTE